MTAPRFSIIMNVYNGERFLREALASVFAQTHRDWELIFWDDQSTDRSAQVLDSFAPDDRVRYFGAPVHTPLGPARDLAIAEARGEWLAFLDQDDIWTADKLEKQARLIDARGSSSIAIVYGRTMKFGDLGMVRDFDHRHEFRDMPEGDIFDSLFVDSCYVCQSSTCLRTACVRDVGPVPADVHFCHDYFLLTELARKHEAACVADVICWYRVHGNAMSNEYTMQVHWETMRIIERWRGHLDPAIYRRRYRIQSTIIGLREVASGSDHAGGLARILRDGSVPYLFSRPFALGYRWLRRAGRYAFYKGARRPTFT